MSLFNFSPTELLTFFAILVRISTLMAVMPFFGDKGVPGSVKVLLSLALSIMLFPTLIARGWVDPMRAAVWSQTASSLIGAVCTEAAFGLVLGFIVKIMFDSIQMGADVIGTLMGLSSANQFDPFQETQTQVISHFQLTLAMLLFLALDGHHIMLQAIAESFRVVEIGAANLTSGDLAQHLITLTGQTLKTGIQIAAPMIITMFGVNIIYGILAKSMPQMNVLVVSFSISAIVGLAVMFLSLDSFHDVASGIFSHVGDEMLDAMRAMAGK
jgi:flagellar biosynthetic protein FliR